MSFVYFVDLVNNRMLFNISDAIYYPRIPHEKEHRIGNHLRSLDIGLPPRIVLLFTVLHVCCAFYKWKARTSTSKTYNSIVMV